MIGGNTTVEIQTMTSTKNAIGEGVKAWTTVQTLVGWIDLMNGEAKYTSFNSKIQESTHVFVSDYYDLDPSIKAENSRLVDEDGLIYDITLIDDPMKLHKQLEILLKFTGGQ